MESQHYANRPGWIIVIYGVFLSTIASFTSFYDAGYLFQANILLAGLLPYLVYVIAVALLPGTGTTTSGAVLAVTHTALVAAVHLIEGIYTLLYTLPMVMAVLLMPLAIIALIKTDVRKDEHKNDHGILPH